MTAFPTSTRAAARTTSTDGRSTASRGGVAAQGRPVRADRRPAAAGCSASSSATSSACSRRSSSSCWSLAAIFGPADRARRPEPRQPQQRDGLAGVERRHVEQPDGHRLAGLRRAVAAALRRPHVAVHRTSSSSSLAGTFGVIDRSDRRLQGRAHRPLADGLGRRAGVVPRAAAGDAADRARRRHGVDGHASSSPSTAGWSTPA